jgi:hypothetical protein
MTHLSLVPKLLKRRLVIPLTKLFHGCVLNHKYNFTIPFYCKGAHRLVWAGSWAARERIPISGIRNCLNNYVLSMVKVKVKLTLQQATKVQRGSRCIALLFLQPRC